MEGEHGETCRGADQGLIDSAAGRLQDLIARTIDDLTDELVERPELTGDGEAAADPELRGRLREWALIKVRIARAAGVGLTDAVLHARRHGATWSAIGAACGISRQGAYLRWREYERRAVMTNQRSAFKGDPWRTS